MDSLDSKEPVRDLLHSSDLDKRSLKLSADVCSALLEGLKNKWVSPAGADKSKKNDSWVIPGVSKKKDSKGQMPLCSFESLTNSLKCCSFNIQGADSSKSECINFFDDDCVYSADYKKRIYEGFLNHDVKSILGYAGSYARDCADKIVLVKSDSLVNGVAVPLKYKGIPWLTRFSPEYSLRIRAQLSSLFDYCGVLTEMTLTCYDFNDPVITHKLIKKNLSKFIAFVRKIAGVNFDYVCSEEVKEEKKSFHVHMHLVIFAGLGVGGRGRIPKKKLKLISDKWADLTDGRGRYIWAHYVDCSARDSKAREILAHALKYPLKSSVFDESDSNPCINLTTAFLFCCGGRAFSTSLKLCDSGDVLDDNRVWVKCGCGYAFWLLRDIKESDCLNADEIKMRYKNINFKSEIDEKCS